MDQESIFDLYLRLLLYLSVSSISDFRSEKGLQQFFIVRGRSEQLQEQSKLVKEYLQNLTTKNNGGFSNPLKSLVSKQKNRFNMNGFDLDLTYITEQVIAMGFPANDYEAIYRNSMEDVQRFFNQRHKNHYKIINLCSERKYDHTYFDGNVSEYPFEDHQAPQFNMIYKLCADVHNYFLLKLLTITQDKQNVVAIHCKAGKGRTGIMICCYLLFSELFKTSFEVMRYYGMMRTKNHKGVTIPSQIRYILYFEKALQLGYTVKDVLQNVKCVLAFQQYLNHELLECSFLAQKITSFCIFTQIIFFLFHQHQTCQKYSIFCYQLSLEDMFAYESNLEKLFIKKSQNFFSIALLSVWLNIILVISTCRSIVMKLMAQRWQFFFFLIVYNQTI